MRSVKSNYKPQCPKMRSSLDIITYPAFIETKLDGEWNQFICKKGKEPYFINKYGKMRYGSLPERVAEATGTGEFVGELFCDDGKKGCLYKMLEFKDSDDLKFQIHDVLSHGHEKITIANLTARLPLQDRKDILQKMLCGTDFLMDTTWVDNKEQVEHFYLTVIRDGYEGVVVKNAMSIYTEGAIEWVKLKERDRNVLTVVHIDPVRERIEVNVNGHPVGVKCSERAKKGIRIGDEVVIEHQGFLKHGLRHPVLITYKEEL